MNRRSFLAGVGSSLVLPYVPKRIYSFGGIGMPQIEWALLEEYNELLMARAVSTFRRNEGGVWECAWGPALMRSLREKRDE